MTFVTDWFIAWVRTHSAQTLAAAIIGAVSATTSAVTVVAQSLLGDTADIIERSIIAIPVLAAAVFVVRTVSSIIDRVTAENERVYKLADAKDQQLAEKDRRIEELTTQLTEIRVQLLDAQTTVRILRGDTPERRKDPPQ